MLKEFIHQKGFKTIEMWECKKWELYRTDATVKNYLRANFPYERPLSEKRLMQEIESGKLFGYVQCDRKVPEHLKAYFANFSPFFKNTVVSRNYIGDLMKEYAEKEGIMSQPRRMLKSSFHLKNGTIITPLLLNYLHLGLDCTKAHQFVQYTPKKCFNRFVQSAVNARRQGDENPNSSVSAKTMKLLANTSYGYQIIDRSRHTVTKYLNDEKTHSAIIKFFLSDLTSSLINSTRLNLSSQKLSIENQSLSDSSFCKMLSSECWSFSMISSKSFAIPKSMKSLKWIPTLYI